MVCVRAAPCKGSSPGRDAGRIPAAQRRGQHHRHAGGGAAGAFVILDGELGRTPPSAPQFSGKQYFLRGNPQEVGVLANIPH